MLHRLEMWNEAEKGLLQTIQVDSATIHWTKKNRELIVNGAYFDVVSISFANGKAVIKGVFDNEETEMHEAFAQKQTNDNAPGNTTQKIAQWLQLLWNIEGTYSTSSFTSIDVKKYPIAPPFPIFLHEYAPPAPPPWQLINI